MTRPVSIGTNMMECGEEWRMAKGHLEPLAAAGVKYVDVHMGARHERVAGHARLRLVKQFVDFRDDRHPKQIRAWLDELELQPVCLHTSMMGAADLASPDEDTRSYAAREGVLMLRVCEVLGVSVMVVHPDGECGAETPRAVRYEQLAKSLDSIVSAAEEAGVRIALENLLPGSIASEIDVLIHEVDRFGHPLVGICLDTGHANVMGWGPAAAVRSIGRRLFALHVHDNDGASDQHLPPLSGCIDWSGFADALDEVGYAGTLNLEVVDRQGGNPASEAFVRSAMEAAQRVLCMR